MKLSIVIPAHNEEQRLPPVLRDYAEYFEAAYGAEVELLVVVNGSTDRTAEKVREFAREHPMVRCLEEKAVIGKGGAVMMGFREAQGELVGFVDADGSTAPVHFDDLVQHIGDADCLIASRHLPGAKVDPPQPFSRRLASRLFNLLVRVLFSTPITDTQCGAKVLKREACRKILPKIGVTRWAFDVDLIFKLRREGCRIVERPTVWRDIGGSQLNIARASTEMLVAMVRLRLLYSKLRGVVWVYDRTIGRGKPHFQQ